MSTQKDAKDQTSSRLAAIGGTAKLQSWIMLLKAGAKEASASVQPAVTPKPVNLQDERRLKVSIPLLQRTDRYFHPQVGLRFLPQQ